MNFLKSIGMPGQPKKKEKTSILFTTTSKAGALHEALGLMRKHGINLTKIESRPSRSNGDDYEFFVTFEGTPQQDNIVRMVQELQRLGSHVMVMGRGEDNVPWFPRKISDLDEFNHQATDELPTEHPGYTDQLYRNRRRAIKENAVMFKHGDKVPRVDYADEDLNTWKVCWQNLTKLFPTHACRQYLHVFPLFMENCSYSDSRVPQLEDVSKFLQDTTGFRIRPLANPLSPREFLNALAFRVFHCTQVMRHHSQPLFSPEADVINELLGHIPMLADNDFADFAQTVGLASLGATEEAIQKLSTLYWFTLEFGLTREGETVKAYGAGLLSSFGELQHCLSDAPELRPFNPQDVATQEYPTSKYQPVYFVVESFRAAKEQLLNYSTNLTRPFGVKYNPYNMSVEVMDDRDKLCSFVESLRSQMGVLEASLAAAPVL